VKYIDLDENGNYNVRGSNRIDWTYPDIYNSKDYLYIDLIHTRASDGIRIRYDSERDGWVIEQPSVLSWDANDKECDPKWKEAAFILSWQFCDPKELT
jgi:hypothetical protein